MNDLAIKVEGLGKCYKIGGKQERYRTMRDTIRNISTAPFRRLSSALRRNSAAAGNLTIQALKDISFEVKRGEVVGIIGRNGAGKSTILKIISRVAEPTQGRAEIYGRVGSLLEVGTGFHPELTGRENIYLNGAILGMKRTEINRKFDEMVAFAEVEKFIDTPVKHYSSGMYLRLAFAVAAHLDPEILLVDEVLAVGDAAFQKKCLGRMGEVAGNGKTVLFVSHDLSAIASLCSKVLVLDQGQLVHTDVPEISIATYLRRISGDANVPLSQREDRLGNGRLRFAKLTMLDGKMYPVDTVVSGDDVTFELQFDAADSSLKNVTFGIRFHDSMGRILFVCHTRTGTPDHEFHQVAPYTKVRCHVPKIPLAPGTYSLTLTAYESKNLADRLEGAAQLTVTAGDFFGTGKLMPPDCGPFLVTHTWKLAGESQ